MPNSLSRHAAVLLLATATLPAAARVSAAEISAAGVAVGDETATVNRITLHHALIWTAIQFEPIAATDPASPFDGLGGSCFGQVEVDGEAGAGGGCCLWTDGSGDALTMRWAANEPGGDKGTTAGTWEAVEGTGKWLQVSGAGTYRLSIDETSGRHFNTLAGTLTIR